jgi:aldehyde oxidoreductase
MEYEIAYDKGAYTELGDGLLQKGVRCMGAPYTIPSIMGIAKCVTSNHNHSTAYKGFGSLQTNTASEQLMDMLAEKIGMDPLEFRYLNVYREGDLGQTNNVFSVYPMADVLDKLRPYYEECKARAAAMSTPEKKRGVGVPCGFVNVGTGAGDRAEVALGLNPDGTVTHYNTWQDQARAPTWARCSTRTRRLHLSAFVPIR